MGGKPMRDHFLDQLGGGRFTPEDPQGDGETKAKGRFFTERGDRVVGNEQDRDANDAARFGVQESRPPGVRLTAWPWLVAGVALVLAALAWIGFSYRQGGRATATVPPAQVTVSKPLVRDVDTRIGLL